MRNQSCSISGLGMDRLERNRNTKNSGNIPCTASPDPLRMPSITPIDDRAIPIKVASSMISTIPGSPDWKVTPATNPTTRKVRDENSETASTPASWPNSSAFPRVGVSASRETKPVCTSLATSVPAPIVANNAAWMKGAARKNAM
jgi:hypothetical protein